ncbi:MAG: hypothetical protein J2P28_12010 [Actinobacteria bacterium]|nr:hypothetical protein [Actinomycetota bacterium]
MSEQSESNGPADQRDQRNQRGSRDAEPGADLLEDLQRWLIRSSARNMRNQFEDQVRRTLRGERPGRSDVWDVATTESPSAAGESPECEWCPICRAARRMRDSGPGLPGQLSGAGDAVASVVQDAVRVLDSLLTRAAGGSGSAGSGSAGSGSEPNGREHGPVDRS